MGGVRLAGVALTVIGVRLGCVLWPVGGAMLVGVVLSVGGAILVGVFCFVVRNVWTAGLVRCPLLVVLLLLGVHVLKLRL